jgi:hypothetical protein
MNNDAHRELSIIMSVFTNLVELAERSMPRYQHPHIWEELDALIGEAQWSEGRLRVMFGGSYMAPEGSA